MTTSVVWAPALAPNTLAGFNDWGSRFSTMLSTIGLTQTADTGQTDWTTNTQYPTGQSQNKGYQVWRFNDTLQATSPIFMRFDFASGYCSNATSVLAVVKLTVGTGSDGAGNITGTWFGPVNPYNGVYSPSAGVIQPVSTNYITHYAMYNATYGCCGIVYCAGTLRNSTGGTPASSSAYFQIARSVDQTTGLPTGDGVYAHAHSTTDPNTTTNNIPIITYRNYSSGVLYTINRTSTNVPGNVTASLYSGGCQAYPQAYFTPQVQYLSQMCTVQKNEFPFGTTFSSTILGSTPLTYISVSPYANSSGEVMTNSGNTYVSAMLWQ